MLQSNASLKMNMPSKLNAVSTFFHPFLFCAGLIHKEVNMFEPKIRQLNAGISEVAQDLQSRLKLQRCLPIFHYR